MSSALNSSKVFEFFKTPWEMKDEAGMRKEEEKAEKSRRKAGATPATLQEPRDERKEVRYRNVLT